MMRFISAVFVFALPISLVHASRVCDAGNSNVESVVTLGKAIEREAILNQFDSDPNLFCDRQLGKRFLSTPFEKESFTKGSRPKADPDEIEQAERLGKFPELLRERALKEFPKFRTAPWALTLVPDEAARRGALAVAMEDTPVEGLDNLHCGPKVAESTPSVQMKGEDWGIDNKAIAKSFVCSEVMGLASAFTCGASVDVVTRIATPPSNNRSMTGHEIFQKVLSDARYDAGLAIAARRIIAKTYGKPGGNLFEDVVQGFRQSGRTAQEANEMAWNVMGLIATSGANLINRLQTMKKEVRFTVQKETALNLIAAAIPLLDHMSAAKGRLYSWPPGVEGSCHTGKSYHFWYTAYLARRAALESGRPEESAIAAFQAAKLYHVIGRNVTKGRSINSVPSSPYTPTSNIVRADLSYSAAGAMFGAASAGRSDGVHLNVDNGLPTLLERAEKGETGFLDWAASKVVGETAERYARWKQVYDPNVLVEKFRVNYPKNVDVSSLQFERNPEKTPCKD